VAETRDRLVVILPHSRNDLRHRRGILDATDALPRAPDILPGLRFGVAARAEIHLRFVGLRQIGRVESGGDQRRPQIVAMNTGNQIGVDDVARCMIDQHLLMSGRCICFFGGDEARSDIGHVCTQHLRRCDAVTIGNRARQKNGLVEPLANFSQQRKRRNWITSEESRAEVQRMRHASDALLTGIGTILADDPLLTDRSGLPRRKRLFRVVLDSKLRLSPKSRIVKTSDDDLLVFTTIPVNSRKARKLQDGGVEVIHAKTKNGRIDLSSVLAELGRREILSVLLEAGPLLNGAALAAGIVHKLFLFYAPTIAGENRVPFALAPKLSLPPLRNVRTQQFGPDFAVEAYLHDFLR